MARGRKPQKRSELAGRRLNTARILMGKSYESLVDDPRWVAIVGVFDPKTVGIWVREGIPQGRVTPVAEYLNIPTSMLVDNHLAESMFEKHLYETARGEDIAGAEAPGTGSSIRSVVLGEIVAIKEKAQRYLESRSSREEMCASTPLLTSIATELVKLPEEQVIAYRRIVTLDMEMRKTGNRAKAREALDACETAFGIFGFISD